VAACHTRSAEKPAGPRPYSPAQRDKRHARPAATRAGRRGGVLFDGSAVAQRRQGVAGDLEGGHREGARKGGEGRGAPERWVDGEAAQMASGGGVQRRRGCTGGHRRARRGPAAPVWNDEERFSSNLGTAKLGGRSPERGKTAAALGKIRREGEASGGRRRRYGRVNGGVGGGARERGW
jgi:hypothetical protein